MGILDVLIGGFLIWALYDTIKKEGIAIGLLSMAIIALFIIILVLVPICFGKTGKIVMYGIFGIIGTMMIVKRKLNKP